MSYNLNNLGFSSNIYSYSITIEGEEYHLSINLIEEVIYIVKINTSDVREAEVICPISFLRILPRNVDGALNMISSYIRKWYVVRNRDEIINDFLNISD